MLLRPTGKPSSKLQGEDRSHLRGCLVFEFRCDRGDEVCQREAVEPSEALEQAALDGHNIDAKPVSKHSYRSTEKTLLFNGKYDSEEHCYGPRRSIHVMLDLKGRSLKAHCDAIGTVILILRQGQRSAVARAAIRHHETRERFLLPHQMECRGR